MTLKSQIESIKRKLEARRLGFCKCPPEPIQILHLTRAQMTAHDRRQEEYRRQVEAGEIQEPEFPVCDRCGLRQAEEGPHISVIIFPTLDDSECEALRCRPDAPGPST